jgi:hypothetical protein
MSEPMKKNQILVHNSKTDCSCGSMEFTASIAFGKAQQLACASAFAAEAAE